MGEDERAPILGSRHILTSETKRFFSYASVKFVPKHPTGHSQALANNSVDCQVGHWSTNRHQTHGYHSKYTGLFKLSSTHKN